MNSSSTNLKDVARAAGVSVSTASRALAGKPTISERTRKRVAQAAAELKYHPNIQARSLRTARTYTIGLIVPTLANPFFATMAAAIQQKATLAGLATIISSYSEDPDQLATSIASLRENNVDGMIVVPNPQVTTELVETAKSGTPVVLIDRELSDQGLPTVASDPQPGIEEAVAHLVDHGHKRIGYLAGPSSLSTGAQRLEAFQNACKRNGVTDEFVYHGGFEVEQGRAGTSELLKAEVTALIAGDSMMSLGAMQYLHVNSVEIGKDLALVGFDDLVYTQVQPKPVSVVDQDVEAMGRKALQLLVMALTSSKPLPDSIRTPTTFMSRASTQKQF